MNRRLVAAFFAGQAVMLGLVLLLRPRPSVAQAEPIAILETETLLIRKRPNNAGVQISGASASGGGPSLSMFDAAGNSRIQMTVSGDTGKPRILIRNKAGKIALGIGLENEEPTIAAANAKGDLVKVPLPKE